MAHWEQFWQDISRRIWFRAALISALAVLLALAAAIIAPLIPYEITLSIGSKAVDAILSILASSMLAVTTFSLTAMVTAFSGASQQITPRAVRLLIEDRTAQNALSTFLGGFVFSLVSLVALATGLYGERGRVVLFFGTVMVTVAIVVTLLGWIARLVHFGRVGDAISRVEDRTRETFEQWPSGVVLANATHIPAPLPFTVRAVETGYVSLIKRKALAALAEETSVRITVVPMAGDFVDHSDVLATVSAQPTDKDADAIRSAFTIRRERDFAGDPRFGLAILAEIAVRALSPGVNDPGTAVQVIGAGQRLLDAFADPPEESPLDRLAEPRLSFEDCTDVLLLPILRSGAGTYAVCERALNMLAALASHLPDTRRFCERRATETLERARRSGMDPIDLERLETCRRSLLPA